MIAFLSILGLEAKNLLMAQIDNTYIFIIQSDITHHVQRYAILINRTKN